MAEIRAPAIVLGLISAVLIATPLAARPLICGSQSAILKHLASRFGEIPFAEAKSVRGHRFVVTLSARGTWTALAVRPGGLACFLDAGGAGAQLDALPRRHQALEAARAAVPLEDLAGGVREPALLGQGRHAARSHRDTMV